MPKTKIPFDKPMFLAGGGILRLSLLTNRHGEPTLLVESTGEITWDYEDVAMGRREKPLTRTARGE